MYVIYPADELILMTYGFFAPRVKPRPSLDCLSEPLVPLDYPATPLNSNNNAATTSNNESHYTNLEAPPPTPSQHLQTLLRRPTTHTNPTDILSPALQSPTVFTFDNLHTQPSSFVPTSPLQPQSQSQSQSLPPTPTRRTSRASLTHSNHSSIKHSSGRSSRSKVQAPLTPPPPTNQQRKLSNQAATPTYISQKLNHSPTSMYNDTNKLSGSGRNSGGGGASYYGEDGAPAAPSPTSHVEYPSGALLKAHDRSPSIFVEPPTPDPTHAHFGPGWGRPMSPMDLPPEASTVTKSPPSKTRLRPKLHIPLGRLGRSTSSDTRESSRLREDVHVHVENPIFSSENLRQNNFDAFFEAREPVIKVQPKTPNTAPLDSGYSAPLENYAGIYDSPTARSTHRPTGSGAGGNLFVRSPREDQQSSNRRLNTQARSRSADQYDEAVAQGGGSASVANDSAGGTKGGAVGGKSGVPPKGSSEKSSSGPKDHSFFGWRGPRRGSLSHQVRMASYNGVLKDYSHSSLNEAFKSQNNANFKLIKTVSDFSESLSQLYEEHATSLQSLVSNYRKKNAELRKERPSCHLTIFQAWETFLQEVESDSKAFNDVASVLSCQVSRPMLDKTFHRKVQSRKIFTHRESFETIIAKTEEKLSKCRLDYKQCYTAQRQCPTQHSLTEYIDAHNAYVQQLHATNGMLEAYHCDTLPQLMQELEEIHNDLCSIVSDSLLQGADVLACKATDQAKRYTNLTGQCSSISATQDLTNFVRILAQPSQAQKVPKRAFAPPQMPQPGEVPDEMAECNEITPSLRDELIFDRHSTLSQRSALESLKLEAIELELQIRQLQDSIDVINRTQTRGIEGQLYNKVNELQEDLSMKKFDLRAKHIHLAAIRAQKELFVSKVEPTSPRNERKFSSATPPSMKTKWLKAFKSLKPASASATQAERRNGAPSTSSELMRPNLDGSHHLLEYTYKKITACDVCSQILRGHTRQGLRCRICKLNAHGDCAPSLPRCHPKQKLLRRQKSTSELENRVDIEEEKITEIDQIYRVLKQAGELKSGHITAADKSVQGKPMDGSVGAPAPAFCATSAAIPTPVVSGTEIPIPIVNVSETAQEQHQHTLAAVAQAAAARAGRGVRPPPVAMPILGVQLQQQELQQQRGGLPVPTQDISSSSGQRYRAQYEPVSNMSSSAYINSGFGINYYTAAILQHQPQQQQQPPQPAQHQQQQSPPTYKQQTSPLHQPQQQQQSDPGLRRRLFAGFRPLSGFGRMRQQRSSQHRSISLPETPHSPRRQKLNLRMKSLSLDSPESSELHGQFRRRQQPVAGTSSSAGYYHGGSGVHLEHSTPPSNNSRLHSPSSPSHPGRKLLYATRGMRGGSVDLPDEMEKSQSSASTSPCLSPVRHMQKSHRLLPTNLYVILYNFKARHADELDLKAGYKVTVIDTSDPDWWKGKILGRIGFFPSKYCVRLNANEKPLQVTHNLQVSDGERGENVTLLRDQIVIQTGDEVNGMVMVRSADNRQGYCPIKYLQEV